MFLELTSPLLLFLTAATAVVMPLLGTGLWRRSVRLRRTSAARNVLRWLAVVAGQVLAVGVAFLVVNNLFSFYTSWDDVFGASSVASSSITSQGRA